MLRRGGLRHEVRGILTAGRKAARGETQPWVFLKMQEPRTFSGFPFGFPLKTNQNGVHPVREPPSTLGVFGNHGELWKYTPNCSACHIFKRKGPLFLAVHYKFSKFGPPDKQATSGFRAFPIPCIGAPYNTRQYQPHCFLFRGKTTGINLLGLSYSLITCCTGFWIG